MKKYKLLKDDFLIHKSRKLFRIQSLIDNPPYFLKGQKGGYIECEENLSHSGNCWVYDNSKVYDFGQLYENAYICNTVTVCCTAKLFGNFGLLKNMLSIGMHDGKRVWPKDYFCNSWQKKTYDETGILFFGIGFIN